MDQLYSALGSQILGMTAANNSWSAEQAQKQMDFQERMSNTAHQREIADLKAAGLNPVLSAKLGGASTPSGASASADSSGVSAMASLATEFMRQVAEGFASGAVSGYGSSARDRLSETLLDQAEKASNNKGGFVYNSASGQYEYKANIKPTIAEQMAAAGMNQPNKAGVDANKVSGALNALGSAAYASGHRVLGSVLKSSADAVGRAVSSLTSTSGKTALKGLSKGKTASQKAKAADAVKALTSGSSSSAKYW